MVNGVVHETLLSALNAWVDAYDTAGIYRHWAADSANVNGGFPVFAAIPCITTTGSDSITVCDSYTWHGNAYTTDTVLVDTISNMMGCDSIVTHHLVVYHGSTATDTVSATDSYGWADTVLTASGIYQHIWHDANGCDSTVNLWLTITRTQYDTITLTDTLLVTDTLTLTDTLVTIQYDTVTLTDTAYISVHDTTYINIHDTTYVDVPYPVHDTTYINVHDTTYVSVHDTTTVYDTIVYYQTDTLWLTDTVYIHDTIYIPQEGIGDVETTPVKLYSRDGDIVVEGAAGREVRMYDVVGRLMATRRASTSSASDGEVRLHVTASGTYLVQVEGLPARRIVVVK